MDIETEQTTNTEHRTLIETEKEEEQREYELEINRRQEKEKEERQRCAHFIGDFNDTRVVEEHYNNLWGFYCEPEQLQKLIEFLDVRGIRERTLKLQLTKKYPKLNALRQQRQADLTAARKSVTATRTLRSKGPLYGRTSRTSTRAIRKTHKHSFLNYSNTLAE